MMFTVRIEQLADGPRLGSTHFWEATCEKCGAELFGLMTSDHNSAWVQSERLDIAELLNHEEQCGKDIRR